MMNQIDIAIISFALMGSLIGFLKYNFHPAKIFMGDTGSLSLGGSLGAEGIITKHEIVLAITGGLFVLEAVSVMVQVISYKLTGKRIFKMAPIHHHFERLARIYSRYKVLDYFNYFSYDWFGYA